MKCVLCARMTRLVNGKCCTHASAAWSTASITPMARFWIRTNWEATNFRLMQADPSAPAKANWKEYLAAREDVFFEGMEAFREHLVLVERENALTRLRVMRWDGSDDHSIAFDEPAYIVESGDNREWDNHRLRFNYESMTTPDSVYEYDMNTRERKLLRRDPVLGEV